MIEDPIYCPGGRLEVVFCMIENRFCKLLREKYQIKYCKGVLGMVVKHRYPGLSD